MKLDLKRVIFLKENSGECPFFDGKQDICYKSSKKEAKTHGRSVLRYLETNRNQGHCQRISEKVLKI